MRRAILPAAILLAGLAACSRGGTANDGNSANLAVQEGDLDNAISGDELSPIPEAEDDMIANSSGAANAGGSAGGNAAGNVSAPPPGSAREGR